MRVYFDSKLWVGAFSLAGGFRGFVRRLYRTVQAWRLRRRARSAQRIGASSKSCWMKLPLPSKVARMAPEAPKILPLASMMISHCRRAWPASATVVVQRVSRVRRAFDAGDDAQTFVDGIEIMVSYVRKRWPWHDLE